MIQTIEKEEIYLET